MFTPFTLFKSAALIFLSFIAASPGLCDAELSRNEVPISELLNQDDLQGSEVLVEELQILQNTIEQRSEPMLLDDVIALGIENNPNLRSLFSIVQDYEWQLIAAQRKWLPTLQAQAQPLVGTFWGSTTIEGDLVGLTAPFRATKSNKRFTSSNLVANWNAIDPTRQPSINAAAEALEEQKLIFESQTREFVLSIQKSYHSLQATLKLIKSFEDIYDINKRQLETLEAQRKIGMVSILEVEQARSQLLLKLSSLIGFTRQYIQGAAELAELLALPQDKLVMPSQPLRAYKTWPIPLEETISRALQQREEIKASLAAAQAANWKGIQLMREYLPVISLYASGTLGALNGFENVEVSLNPRGLQRSWDSTVAIGLNWKIYDGGIKAADAESARARAREFTAKSSSEELKAIQQVRSSYAAMKTAEISIISATAAYKSAQITREAAQARYNVGVDSMTTIVQSIDLLSTAAQDEANALLTYNNAIADLYRFSATWPGDTRKEVEQRILMMRKNPDDSALQVGGGRP